MKIDFQKVAAQSLQEFADAHDLTLKIGQRADCDVAQFRSFRFYACFSAADITDGVIAHMGFGEGNTPLEAVRNYARNISGRTLVRGMGRDATRFTVPELTVPDDILAGVVPDVH